MCIFRGQTGQLVEGLLASRRAFPIPVQEDFGGDVMLGWRRWTFNSHNSRLASPNRGTNWIPGEPMVSVGSPSLDTGRGLYCNGSKAVAEQNHQSVWGTAYTIFGQVACWGRVLNFTQYAKAHPTLSGCMAEFMFPLELHLNHGSVDAPRECQFDAVAEKLKEQWGPFNVHVFRNGVRV